MIEDCLNQAARLRKRLQADTAAELKELLLAILDRAFKGQL
jgi:hypothetical protein